MTRRLVGLAVAGLVLAAASWIDPHAKAREAARLYSSGDFDAATTKYNEALVDDPDSTLLHYNLGASAYKGGKYEDAISAYAETPGADVADVAYNIGNAKYRLGAAAEASEPEKALGLYAEAIAAYRRAMGADPADEDAKLNHELVTRKLDELRKKLEEQKQKEKEQQQQEQDQQQDQQQQADQEEKQPSEDGEPKDEQSQNQGEEKPSEQSEQQENAEQQAGGERQDRQEQEPRQQEQAPQSSEAKQGGEQSAAGQPGEALEMTEQEAKALLDAARDQEARPEEITRRMQPAGVLDPAEDW